MIFVLLSVFWGYQSQVIDVRASMTWLAMYTAQSNIFMLKKVRLKLVNSVLINYYRHACTHSITKKKVVKA